MITSEADLIAAIGAANRDNLRTTLNLSGQIDITRAHAITAPVSLRGPARLRYRNNGQLLWKGRTEGWHTLMASAFGETVKTDAPVSPGSYLLMLSDDIIPIDPHHARGTQHPQELHLVNYAKDGVVGVEAFTVDRMAGNCAVMHPISNISITDLEFDFEDKVQKSYSTAIKFDGVANGVIEDVHFLRSGPGAIWLNNSYNCRVQCRIDGTVATDDVYGLVVGTVNHVTIEDSLITGCRHAFTTTAGTSMAGARWGTPINVVLRNSTINVPTKLEISPIATRVGLDTHAEGYQVTWDGVTVNLGTNTSNYGAFVRSRAAKILRCVFNGGPKSKAIEIYGPDAVIDQCVIDGAWVGVATKQIRGPFANHCSVTNTLFRNLTGPPVTFESGKGHVVGGLRFDQVMTSPGTKYAGKSPVIGDYTTI